MSQLAENPLEAGRDAAERHAWRDAYDLLKASDEQSASLGGDDLERLANAAWWTGRLDEALKLRERAHAAYLEEGSRRRAAVLALTLSEDFLVQNATAVANGWFCRGERLLADEEESLEHGRLEMARAMNAFASGDIDGVLEHAKRAGELGRRYGDRDLEAFELAFTGRALTLKGEVDKGLALIDEAARAAVAGELRPDAGVSVYCLMISACASLGDYRRAGEWTEAAESFCEQLDASGYPGMCRVHRAELMSLRGDWTDAERAAVQACAELGGYNVWVAAAGYYELGEIRRRMGDFAAAEEAYRTAKELGREPQPGLALIRLAQGKVDAAVSSMRRALEGTQAPTARMRLLPAQVEIAVAAGDLKTARAAAEELETIADSIRIGGARTTAFEANAQLARAQIMLGEGDAAGAAACARRARELWHDVGAPYETARARVVLGLSYRRQGDEEGATEELAAAKAAFERLGAVLDAQRVSEYLGEIPLNRTFVFTDIVDSTKLGEALGEEKWKKLLAWHDRALREQIEKSGGQVIKQTGDGFFAAFENPGAAVAAAVAIQRALADHDGVAPDVRIGLHAGGAFSKDETDFGGQGVHAAARIGALAGAGEILASRDSVRDGARRFSVSDPRAVELKGISEPVDVVSVAWR